MYIYVCVLHLYVFMCVYTASGRMLQPGTVVSSIIRTMDDDSCKSLMICLEDGWVRPCKLLANRGLKTQIDLNLATRHHTPYAHKLSPGMFANFSIWMCVVWLGRAGCVSSRSQARDG
jgi:hypothetical protein